jgi:hypothetical protein
MGSDEGVQTQCIHGTKGKGKDMCVSWPVQKPYFLESGGPRRIFSGQDLGEKIRKYVTPNRTPSDSSRNGT